MRAGDHVYHEPSGETWVVAYVTGDDLCPCGWPESLARVADCTLVKSCSDDEHRSILEELREIGGSRARHAKRALEALAT